MGDVRRYLSPGQSDTLELGTLNVDSALVSLPRLCMPQWTVQQGVARITSPEGVLWIPPHAPTPDTLVVEARVGMDTVSRTFVVGRHIHGPPVRDPDGVQGSLVGMWRQVGEIPCARPGVTREPAEPIRELRFESDGRFMVTWTPFETYVDYWGTYRHDLDGGDLVLRVDGGNHVPDDLDLEGHARWSEDGTLRLEGMFLGSPRGGMPVNPCGSTWRRVQG